MLVNPDPLPTIFVTESVFVVLLNVKLALAPNVPPSLN